MQKKNVVIIGGGISGLSCGIFCQMAGLSTIILEKNNTAGGNLTGWYRKGTYIDNCIHWLNGSSKNSEYHQLLNDIGAINDKTKFHQSKYFYVSELNGKHVGVMQDLNKTEEEMIENCPEDKKQIKKFISALKCCTNLINCESNYKKMLYIFKLFSLYGKKTLNEVAKKCKTQLMQNFFTDYVIGDYSIYVLLLATSSFVSGDGMIPTCGSLNIAKNIVNKYISLGGQLSLNSNAKSTEINNKNVVKITCENGKEYYGDYFVFACDPTITFDKLLKNMPKNLKNTYKNRKNYPIISSFQVAYDISVEDFNMPESFVFECNPIKVGASYYSRIMLRNYSYGKDFAQTGHTVLQVFLLQKEKDYDYFSKLSNLEYAEDKKRICKQLLQAILKRFPRLKSKITQLDCWTPLTYTRYFDSYKGSYLSFGVTKQIRLSSVKSKLSNYNNAYIATQWQSLFGGIPNAMTNGKNCAKLICQETKD